MINIRNLKKTYGPKLVLDDITIGLEAGRIYGLFGKNGAGKTTLLKILANQIIDYKGEVLFKNRLITKSTGLEGKILYLGGSFNENNDYLMQKLEKIIGLYDLFLDSFDRDYAYELMSKFSLNKKDKYKKLSRGSKVLFQNILGLASNAQLVIFDEPVNGLDSVNRYKFYQELMASWTDSKKTYIVSSHLMGELENYLTDILILKDNNIFLADRLENVQAKSKLVTGVRPDKKIIRKKTIMMTDYYYVYDDFSKEEILEIESAGGRIDSVNLQDLFVYLMEEENEQDS